MNTTGQTPRKRLLPIVAITLLLVAGLYGLALVGPQIGGSYRLDLTAWVVTGIIPGALCGLVVGLVAGLGWRCFRPGLVGAIVGGALGLAFYNLEEGGTHMSQEVGVVLLVVAGLMQVAAIAVSSWILSGDHPQTDSPQTPSMEASLATGRAWLRGEGAPIWKGMVVLIVVAALAWAAISVEESIGDPMLAVWLGWLAGLLVFGLALGLIVLALLPKKNARHSNAIDEDDRSSPNEDHPEGTLRSDQRV